MSFLQGHVNGLSIVEIKRILLQYLLDYILQWWGFFILDAVWKKYRSSC